ncbi:hypothetical protein glysoja_040833 [Glycine soja]|uniref:Uncharacterized protein n=1 Tax=Glycine soja TaxID=3848 RepID=A0A0B2SAC4_GLYSO|nr:hypothetical protein glysoja_040833 [Glycine soja]
MISAQGDHDHHYHHQPQLPSSTDTSRFAKALAFFEDIRGSSVLFLPCSLYNWTLPEGARLFHGMPLDVKIYATHQLEFLEVADLIFVSCRKAGSTTNNL